MVFSTKKVLLPRKQPWNFEEMASYGSVGHILLKKNYRWVLFSDIPDAG